MPTARRALLPLVLLALCVAVLAQDPGRPPLNRERMWPAPTAEDWKKPCLIKWQRTWPDALAVAEETGKPILICVNMDGEIASEHYAGIRYRQPEIAKLYENYVTVIASTYRHNPRDYDDEGHRIPCPRFGTVTCGEHIAIEPILYERFFDGQRVAPRHIMVELDGTETYDVYYRNDVASVFEDIRKGIDQREMKPKVVVRGDRTIVERVASRDVADREAVEEAYRDGDEKQRHSLLEAAKKLGGDTPLELLRLGIFGLDVELGKLARSSLAQTTDPAATDLISDALSVPIEDSERESLLGALSRLGKDSWKAKWLAVVHRGLSARSSAIDLSAWVKSARKEYEASARAADLSELEARQREKERSHEEKPKDALACIEAAEASLDLARKARQPQGDVRMAKLVARHMFEDARRSALEAEKLGAPAWRVNTVLALAAYYRGELATAYAKAAEAVRELPPGEPSWNAMAVLTVFGEGRYKAIKEAAKAGRDWSPGWLADLDAAYTALLHHPLATDSQILWYYDFLVWLGAHDRATRTLRAALERFPTSPALHRSLREHLLRRRGVRALQAEYDRILDREKPSVSLLWFGGIASITAGDFYRRMGRREEALAAYARGIERYEGALKAEPGWKDAADHRIALAFASRARLEFERGEDERATEEIVRSFERRPASAGTKDGIGMTPGDTAQMLIARLTERGRDDLIAKIVAALEKVDPELLLPNEE